MKTYSGVFFSVLTIPEYEEPIETLDDLERVAISGEYDIMTAPNTFYYDLFVKAEHGPYHTIGEAIKRVDMHPDSTQLGIELINKGALEHHNIIFIYSQVSLIFRAQVLCNGWFAHIIRDTDDGSDGNGSAKGVTTSGFDEPGVSLSLI